MVNIETIKLSQVKVNGENPRTISGDKFQKLVNSILVFPKMLEIRPVVVDSAFVALGGNMRTNALNFIAKMPADGIAERLATLKDYNSKTEGERKALAEYWGKWHKSPTVQIIKADKLTKAEQQQFIVKDNVQFGNWDYDLLANGFDEIDLGNWGMDVWQPQPAEFSQTPTATTANGIPTNPPANSEDDGAATFGNLPPELDGVDCTPADLPNLQGDDATEMQRVIIVYRPNQAEALCNLLGLSAVDKVLYNIDELASGNE